MIFDRLGRFIVKRYKLIIFVWIIILIVSIPLSQRMDDVVVYQEETSGVAQSESEKVQQIIEAEFPKSVSNSSIIIVVKAEDVTSAAMRDYLLELEHRIGADTEIKYLEEAGPLAFPKGFVSVYVAERFTLMQAVGGMNTALYQTEAGLNQSANLIWGIPAMYVQSWSMIPSNITNIRERDAMAYNSTITTLTYMNTGADPVVAAMSRAYFQLFADAFNASAANLSLISNVQNRTEHSVHSAASMFASSIPDQQQAQLMLAVASSFNLNTFSDRSAVHAFTIAMIAQSANIGDPAFLEGAYALGQLDALAPEVKFGIIASYVNTVVMPNGTIATYPVGLPAEYLSMFISSDNTTTIINLGFSKKEDFTEGTKEPILENVDEIRSIIAGLNGDHAIAGLKTYVSGSPAISSDLREAAFGDMWIIEFVTVPLIIILMGLFFRSVLTPFLPLSLVMIALGVSQAMVFIIGVLIGNVSSEVTTMLFTILMGVGTDYSIFIIARYREERIRGANREDAVATSVTWAGESITTSGATVMISFFALGIASYSMIRIMGLVLGMSILIALLIALTLVPSFIMLIGNRIFWPTNKERFKRYSKRVIERRTGGKRGYFYRAASFSVNHAKLVVALAVLISIPTTYIYLTAPTSFDFVGAMPEVESTNGIEAMTEGFGAGRIMPTQVVLVMGERIVGTDGNFSTEYLTVIESVSAELSDMSIVNQITGPSRPYGKTIDFAHPERLTQDEKRKMYEFVGKDNRSVLLSVVLNEEPSAAKAVDQVPNMRSVVEQAIADTGSEGTVEGYVGGSTAGVYDISDIMDREFLQMRIVVMVGIFIVLLIVLGSLLLPLFAIISIGMSISWSFAATILIFQNWLGLPVLWLVPLILFIMLMGIGMDYNIFILTRIREEVHKGKSDKEAIVDAVDWTGGIITALALIMGGAIGALMLSSTIMLAEFGFALMFAILLDAMVVRTYIVPAVMKLLGKWNWYAPGPLQRVRIAKPSKPAPNQQKPEPRGTGKIKKSK